MPLERLRRRRQPRTVPDAPPAVTVPENAWTDVSGATGGAPGTQLLTTIIVNGTSLHLEAIEVAAAVDPWAAQEAADEASDETLLRWLQAADATEPLATTTIAGRTYALFASPHTD